MGNNLADNLWLIGAGGMAREYARVLKAIGKRFTIVGRDKVKAEKLGAEFSVPVISGGAERAIEEADSLPSEAIVATSIESAHSVILALCKRGVKRILAEKPVGATVKAINEIAFASSEAKSELFAAFNRRFYTSVRTAKEMLVADGGVRSFHFDFTEWLHKLEQYGFSNEVKSHWWLHNSSHVFDLAFFLGGTPLNLSSNVLPDPHWPCNSVFAGSGVTTNKVPFSFHANWRAPGRWSVEVCSKSYRFFFSPLEKLRVQRVGTVVVEEVPLHDQLDREFKAGVYLQTKAFLEKRDFELVSLSEFVDLLPWYVKIAGVSGR